AGADGDAGGIALGILELDETWKDLGHRVLGLLLLLLLLLFLVIVIIASPIATAAISTMTIAGHLVVLLGLGVAHLLFLFFLFVLLVAGHAGHDTGNLNETIADKLHTLSQCVQRICRLLRRRRFCHGATELLCCLSRLVEVYMNVCPLAGRHQLVASSGDDRIKLHGVFPVERGSAKGVNETGPAISGLSSGRRHVACSISD